MTDGRKQYLKSVFPAELQELQRRRRNVGDERALPDDAAPDVDLELTGLAISGGGIRSASFALGVVQHLLQHDRFRRFDYLSTVSGGGYLGSCLSALMKGEARGEQLLIERGAHGEPPALNHLRNGSNYLLSTGQLDKLRLPAIFVRGLFHTLLLLMPSLVLCVFATELLFEVAGRFLNFAMHYLPIIGVLPLIGALMLRPVLESLGLLATRERRDVSDRRLAGYLVLAVLSLLAVPALAALARAVNHDLETVIGDVQGLLQTQLALGLSSWLFWTGLVGLVLLFLAWRKLKGQLVVLAFGLGGHLALILLYLAFCLHVINTPSAGPREVGLTDMFGAQSVADVEKGLTRLLKTKHIDPREYHIREAVAVSRVRGAKVIVIQRRKDAPTAPLPDALTTSREEQLTIHYVYERRRILIDELSLLDGKTEWWFYLAGLALWLYNCLFININRISQHPFFRDRLSTTFLITPEAGSLVSADELKLSELGRPDSRAPYHLVNTALNLQGSTDPQLRERRTVPFVFAKRYSGSHYTGYCETKDLEELDSRLNLGTAFAVSAAAASPNMGVHSVRSLTFLLALLNIRLNYWLPQPQRARRKSLFDRLIRRHPGLHYLFAEARGNLHDRDPFLNLSDGGHIENLAVYELLRRRCKTIVCIDGEADPTMTFHGFNTLQRYAQIDLGAKLTLDLGQVRLDENGRSPRQHAIGTITYADGSEGTFVYLKLSYHGDEPEYLRFYKLNTPVFPHEATSDQFFGETQFEVYRALGNHVAGKCFTDEALPEALV